MKEQVNDRIIELIKSLQITSQKFAGMLNVQSSSISHITSKRNKPSYDLLYNILEVFPDVSPDWLLLGQGEMYRKTEPESVQIPAEPDLFSFMGEDEKRIVETPVKKEVFPQEPEIEKQSIQPVLEEVVIQEQNRETISKLVSKKLSKVLFFYEDHTFEVFDKE